MRKHIRKRITSQIPNASGAFKRGMDRNSNYVGGKYKKEGKKGE